MSVIIVAILLQSMTQHV